MIEADKARPAELTDEAMTGVAGGMDAPRNPNPNPLPPRGPSCPPTGPIADGGDGSTNPKGGTYTPPPIQF